jgi:hypothetical protein
MSSIITIKFFCAAWTESTAAATNDNAAVAIQIVVDIDTDLCRWIVMAVYGD